MWWRLPLLVEIKDAAEAQADQAYTIGSTGLANRHSRCQPHDR